MTTMWRSQNGGYGRNAQQQKKKKGLSLWDEICEESEQIRRLVWPERSEEDLKLPDGKSDGAVAYLEEEVFPVLLPALEACLSGAEDWGCLEERRCVFDGLDRVAEFLWNSNPRRPERRLAGWTDVYEIPFVREWLEAHPRPVFPKSWLWTRDEASVVVQSAFRGHLVRRRPDVQEMRNFWRVIREERTAKETATRGESPADSQV